MTLSWNYLSKELYCWGDKCLKAEGSGKAVKYPDSTTPHLTINVHMSPGSEKEEYFSQFSFCKLMICTYDTMTHNVL